MVDISRLSAPHSDYIFVKKVDPEIDSCDVCRHLDYTTSCYFLFEKFARKFYYDLQDFIKNSCD